MTSVPTSMPRGRGNGRALGLLVAALLLGCAEGPPAARNLGNTVAASDDDDSDGKGRKKKIDAAAGLADEVYAIFEKECRSCHGKQGDGRGEFDILDFGGLVEQELVVPGSPSKSPLWLAIDKGEMPQGGELSGDQKQKIKSWIAKGAISPDADEDRQFIKEAALHRMAAEDLTENFKKSERQHVRYISIAHLYNGGVPRDILEDARQGIAKLLNSLSTARKLAPLKAVDEARVLFRIDLRDYEWDGDRWALLIKSYAYQLKPNDTKYLALLQADTETPIPILRGDWFLSKASAAPLYYQMLRMPGELALLEPWAGVATAQNLESKAVIRAGFDDSLVSSEHRIIERHDSEHGVFWRSYEFGSKVGLKNALDKPLGPLRPVREAKGISNPITGNLDSLVAQIQKDGGEVPESVLRSLARMGGAPLVGDASGTGAFPVFDEDGGEFLFSLPNGMLGFYVAMAGGQRLNEAPPDEGEEPIVAGRSCMNCHSRGFIPKDDQVRSRAKGNGDLAPFMATIEAIFPEPEDFKRQIEKDSELYRKALEKIGVDPDRQDPVNKAARRFELDLSLSQAAAELGVDATALEELLERDDFEDVKEMFSGRSISRKNFNYNFRRLATALKSQI